MCLQLQMLIIQQLVQQRQVIDPIPTTVFTTTQTAVSCNGGADGTITVNVTAGEGPYESIDSGGFQIQCVSRIKCRNSVCGNGA
jgi:hypothetical protein